jgi:DNA polymerase III subunit gamma/tau
MPFDLAYRPRRFSDVLGNDGIKRLILSRSRGHTLADQSMMFSGPKGCGKTSLARIVARAIKCPDLRDGEPCNECPSCVSILEETNPDVEELDAASQGTVDRIREMISDADYGTFDGTDVRIYLVDEAQRLSKPAQDAFLKAIESRLFIVIMCTTEPKKILGTIVDRVEEYPVHAPPQSEIEARLRHVCAERGIQADDAALSAIVQMNRRTPRTSLTALEGMSVLGPVTVALVGEYYRLSSYEAVAKFLSTVDFDIPAALAILDDLSHRESPTWIRDTMIEAVTGAQRVAIGSVSSYPVPVSFFPIRGRDWVVMARELGTVDRPSMADIEAVVLSGCPAVPLRSDSFTFVPPQYAPTQPPVLLAPVLEGLARTSPVEVVQNPPSPPSPPPPPPPLPPPPPAPTPSPSVEIDGVLYSREETLTSLDRKIVKVEAPPERTTVRVELDKSRVPQSEGEFANGFKRRLGLP